MPNRLEVVRAARRLIGVPFRHQGRTVEGIDCVGLLIHVARSLDIAHGWPEMPYAKFPPADYVRGVLDRYLNELSYPPEAGDIALIRWRRTANHLAIVGDGDKPYTLIHAYYVMGRVVEHRADPDWQDRIVALYSFRGVE